MEVEVDEDLTYEFEDHFDHQSEGRCYYFKKYKSEFSIAVPAIRIIETRNGLFIMDELLATYHTG